MYIHIYIYIYTCSIYIYIYIYRERERDTVQSSRTELCKIIARDALEGQLSDTVEHGLRSVGIVMAAPMDIPTAPVQGNVLYDVSFRAVPSSQMRNAQAYAKRHTHRQHAHAWTPPAHRRARLRLMRRCARPYLQQRDRYIQ